MRNDSIMKHNREFIGSLNPRYFTEEEMGKIKEGLEAEDFDMMEDSLLSGLAKQREHRKKLLEEIEEKFVKLEEDRERKRQFI